MTVSTTDRLASALLAGDKVSASDALLEVPTIRAVRDQVLAAAADGCTLNLLGGGTKRWLGQPAADDRQQRDLSLAEHRGIVLYDPSELVIVARAGTPLAELEAALAEHRQVLAFEPPRLGVASTIGGVVAAGLSGPRRLQAGSLRDFMLGVTLMRHDGHLVGFGGTVMKNVAGYDVSRLLAGSMGTLGPMLELAIKVVPKPAAQQTLRFELDEAAMLDQVNRWCAQPLPIAATAWRQGLLSVRLAGAEAAVQAAVQRLGGEVLAVEQAQAYWDGLRDLNDPFFAGDALAVWRLAVPSTSAVLGLAGDTLIEWAGGQRWLRAPATDAAAIRARAAAVGGHATLLRATEAERSQHGTYHALTPGVAAIHRRLKAEFDPNNLFNPGRMGY